LKGNKTHTSVIFRIVLLTILTAVFSQCRVTKSLEEGEQLLVKSEIKLKPKANVDEETLHNIVKQKPNNKLFFFFRFNAWLHNKYDEEKCFKHREKKQKRIDKSNSRRTAKGKEKLKKSNETWRDRIVKNLGEEPSVYDSLKTQISEEQLEIYLQKNGYFSASVDHKLKRRTKKKVRIEYLVNPGKAHFIESIEWNVKDSLIKNEISEISKFMETSAGDQFRVEVLDNDRAAISKYLNNQGFYDFSKEYISFKVDTLNKAYKAGISIVVANTLAESAVNPDSLVPVFHKKYEIGRVNFHLDYDPLSQSYEPKSILIGKHTFEYLNELELDPELLMKNVVLKQGETYRLKDESDTYKKLRNLGIFSYVNIKFEETARGGDRNVLNVDVYLNRGKSQGVSFEVTGTHRDGIWGANMKSGYTHNNLWKGAESLEINLSLGAEAQRSIADTDNSASGGLSENLRLNTLHIGPEVNINLHKLTFLKSVVPKWTSNLNSPLTTISGVFNYQIRPDFERTLGEVSLTWKYREKSKNLIFLSPLDLSIIDITKSQAFQDRLDEINDQFLLNSYRDHIILSNLKGVWEYNNQVSSYQKRHFYNRFGVAARVDIGVGIPYGNAFVLPFEKSFFAGGANGIRAWQARSLGPGSYRDTSALVTFSNLGEVKFTMSTEYRFDLTNLLEGAFFIDAGNIWILKDEDNKAGAEFDHRFLEAMAVGAGLGFRLDFEFFLVRFDLGFKIKDPSLVSGERWFWQPKDDYNLFLEELRNSGVTEQLNYSFLPNLNLGIGYPF